MDDEAAPPPQPAASGCKYEIGLPNRYITDLDNDEQPLKGLLTGTFKYTTIPPDIKDGAGKIIVNEAILYSGTFKNGYPHGTGTYYRIIDGKSVKYYVGDFKKGQMSGQGKLYDSSSGKLLMQGRFEDGNINGSVVHYRDGDIKKIYIEGIQNGDDLISAKIYNEAGIMVFKGDIYGKGTLYSEITGRKLFEGEMSKRLPHGKAVQYYNIGKNDGRDKLLYDGDFIFGIREGYGILKDIKGFTSYEGQWKNNKPDGTGRAWVDGKKFEGIFIEGVLKIDDDEEINIHIVD